MLMLLETVSVESFRREWWFRHSIEGEFEIQFKFIIPVCDLFIDECDQHAIARGLNCVM